ncbi:MAG: hypothetical protein EOO77_15015 [Oxalobacteraceae bacterium]|nr:MAG: hypothetical protein EOO77_15015 [Oxalobacteraceae bacterium]
MAPVIRKATVVLAVVLAIVWSAAVAFAAFIFPYGACWGKAYTCPQGMLGSLGIMFGGLIALAAAIGLFSRLLTWMDRPRDANPTGSAE